jgi:serine/threonine-protein kinase
VSPDDLVGRRFAHYRVLERIGAGGMGVVYRAHDETLDREVVLKLLPEETIGDAAARAGLLDEARKAAGLNHPNVCTIHEVGEAEGQVYIAMERVDGQTLGERIGSRGLPVETAIALAIQIADAVARAHDRGIIHRDLKSANVIVTSEGRAKVLDFGIARRVDPASQATASSTTATVAGTIAGTIAGTAHYLPPEAFRGERVDARGDVWALGVLLHEMLTGGLPFRGNTEFELGAAVLNAEPAPLPANVPAGLRSVIQRCLVKDPAGRFQRASEVRAVLEMVRGESAGMASHAPPMIAAPRAARRPRPLLVAAVVALLIVAAIAIGMALRGRRTPGPGAIRSLAVLPLENLSRDPEQEYFADGMTEELITSLANLEGVSVISRTSTMRYKGTKKSIPQIARELGVDAVIEGSALRAGGDVRISAQLIEAATDRHLWARSYQRSLANVLALQGEVAQAIAAEIRATLTPKGKARVAGVPALNPAAYEEYLKGRYEWGKRDRESLLLAIAHFERAIAAESSYAPAWAGLADAHAVIPYNLREPARPRLVKALEAVRHALRLDPQLAEAHATLGMLKYRMEYDWAGSDSEFRTALALNPSYASAHQWYGLSLAVRGRLDEASAELARARALDPYSTIVLFNEGQVLLWQRRYDEAILVLRQVVESSPGSGGHAWLARAYHAKRMYPSALAEFMVADSLEGGRLHRDDRIRSAALAGDTKQFWRLSVADGERRTGEEYVSRGTMIVGYTQLGDHDRALHWVERALDEGDARILSNLRDATLDPLRSDARFAALLRKHGLEP